MYYFLKQATKVSSHGLIKYHSGKVVEAMWFYDLQGGSNLLYKPIKGNRNKDPLMARNI